MKTITLLIYLTLLFTGLSQNNQYQELGVKYNYSTGLNISTTIKADFYSSLSLGIQQEYAVQNELNCTRILIGVTPDDFISMELGLGAYYCGRIIIPNWTIGARIQGTKGLNYNITVGQDWISVGVGYKLWQHNELDGWKSLKY